MTYTIERITALIGARRYGRTNASIVFLLTDSRSLCFAEETLFFAIKTMSNDGSRYLSDLYKRGVRNFVVNEVPENYEVLYPNSNFLKVSNTLDALQRLAERHRDEFAIPVIGITGSNGKTMVKEWIYQLLSPSLIVTRSPRSYNSQTGVPLSVWVLTNNTQLGVFEAGISEPGEMDSLRDIIQPTIGILTTIGDAHQENFTSLEEKCNEKLKLFTDSKLLIYNEDDSLVKRCVEQFSFKGQRFSVSRQNEKATLYVFKVLKNNADSIISYSYKGIEGSYKIPFIDEASIEDSIECLAVGLYLGIDKNAIEERMASLEPVAMRLEVKEGRHDCTLINDSYNSDINSLDIALDFMSRRPDAKERQRVLILSDIYQTGKPLSQLYSEVSALMKQRNVDQFIGVGPEIGAHQDCFEQQQSSFFLTVQDFIDSELFSNLRDNIILLKGARRFGFDKITELLVKKVHETTLEVNLSALVQNLNFYRSYLKQDTKLVCMIKANGYGSGAVEVAKTLQDHRVDYLAVAVADEGVALRKHGVTANVMIMNPEMSSFKTIFDYELEPEVYSFRLLEALIEEAEKEGITQYPIHIKLDTGMHRLGFDPIHDMERLISILKKHQNTIIPRSVFSHFVGSDSDNFDDFSAHQFSLFDKASKQLQAAFTHHILRHIDNSAGILHFPDRQLDMCRLGLGLYGINSRDNQIINNVCSLRTTILQMHKIGRNETVGYSRKGTVERETVVAAIPIGYADGLDRRLGNRNCYCLVNGHKAPYLGNICMDVAMIDVTDIPCKEGDSVEIFGDKLPVTVLSDTLGTIPYEVLTSISERVKRVYFQD